MYSYITHSVFVYIYIFKINNREIYNIQYVRSMCCVNIFILGYIGIFSPFYSSITLCTCILQILIFFKVIRLSLCIFKSKIHLLDVTFCYTRNTQNVLKLNKYNCVKTSSMSLKRSKRSVHQMCNSNEFSVSLIFQVGILVYRVFQIIK